MKKLIIILFIAGAVTVATGNAAFAQQPNLNVVHIVSLKQIWPEKGSMSERDSLIAIYNDNVVKKNDKILSHREYSHYYTSDSKDYRIIEEFKSFSEAEEAGKMTGDLEKKAWPDEKKRKEFMDSMNKYFEDWHGDAVYRINPKLSK